MTSLLGCLRWLGCRERAGLADLLKQGERGLGVATRLSPWLGAIEIRRIQGDESRREWDTCGSFSGTGAGGLVNVWPRRCSLTGANRDLLRGMVSSEGRPLSAPLWPTSRDCRPEGGFASAISDGFSASEPEESVAFVRTTGVSCKWRVFLPSIPNLGEA